MYGEVLCYQVLSWNILVLGFLDDSLPLFCNELTLFPIFYELI